MAETGGVNTVDATERHPVLQTSLAALDAAVTIPVHRPVSKNSQANLGASPLDVQAQFDCTALYAEVFDIRDEVHDDILKCHKKLKLPDAHTIQKSDWNEVDASVKEACDDIQRLASERKAMTGAVGKLRRAFGFLCKHAGAGETFVSVIPTDQFGFASVLCGGLKAVFSALKHSHEYREKVFLALEDLPYTICDHSVPLDDQTNDEELHRRAAGLHIAVFKVIRRILRWWLSGTVVFTLKSLANPSKLLSDLNEDLAEVKVNASRFRHRALKITQKLQRESVQLQYLAGLELERNTLEVQGLRRDVKSIKEMLCRSDSLNGLASTTPRISSGPVDGSLQLSVDSTKLHRRRSEPNVGILLANFFYERDLVINDYQALMKLLSPQRNSGTNHDRILAIEATFRVQAWLVIDEPSLLLIDGRAESRRDVEVSVFVARIVHQLHCWQAEVDEFGPDAPEIVPVAFFCGRHRQRQDTNSNPTELAMSLLLQLIDRHRAGFRPSLIQKLGLELDPRNMSSICSKVEELIMKLRKNVVLILLVDGLIHFTQDEVQTSQTRELISCLIGIYRKRPAATLKLLFSSPTRPDFVEDLFLEKELLRLPRSVASAHSPHNMRWKKPVEFRSGNGRDDEYR